MQSTGHTLTHPVSTQSIQRRVIVHGIGANPLFATMPNQPIFYPPCDPSNHRLLPHPKLHFSQFWPQLRRTPSPLHPPACTLLAYRTAQEKTATAFSLQLTML